MITKPRFLIGDVIEPTKLLKSFYHDSQKFDETSDFIEQDFSPEMITEYFEGWEETISQYHYKHKSNVNWHIAFGSKMMKIQIKMDMNIPKTLSQFITNTIQAGIKLTWR